MNAKEIDLTGKKGVTLQVEFDFTGRVTPFCIYITGDKGILYYYRYIELPIVSINLPEHSDKVLMTWQPNYSIKQMIVMPIKIYKIKYVPNEKIVQKRPYKFEEIRKDLLPFIPKTVRTLHGFMEVPSDHPARFLPAEGLQQFSSAVMSELPQPVRVFIMKHEDGHYMYGRPLPSPEEMANLPQSHKDEYMRQMLEDEEEADRYALYQFINLGYNFSGALYSLMDNLKETYISKSRVNKIYNEINRIHKNLSHA